MDTGSAKYQDIQKECKRLGLRAVGRRNVLIRRLVSSASHRQNSLTLQSQEDTEFQPSYVDRAESHEEGEIHEEGIPELATRSLVPVMQGCRGDLKGEISDQLVERRRGPRVDLATRVEFAEKAVTLGKKRCESLDKNIAENQLRLNSLEESVGRMTASVGTYHFARNRFLTTFKDKLGRATEADLRIIAEGEFIPEGGDAATDAMLYEGINGRRDFTTFQKLYGLQPETVRKIRESSCYLQTQN